MRLVFMGTPEFAVPSLLGLVSSEHEVLFVVSQPDRPQGRGYKVVPPPVKVSAEQAGLRVLQPGKLAEIKDELTNARPEAVIVVAFGQKVPSWLLELPRWGCINLHPSLLPKYRGAAPIQAAILNGDAVTGVSSMRLDEGWDTGDILLQQEVPILPGETSGQLHDRLAEIGAQLILATLSGLEKGEIAPEKQDDSRASFAPKLTKEAAKIDWARPAKVIANSIRANNPWPVAWTELRGETLKIWAADLAGDQPASVEPGTVIWTGEDQIVVQTGCGQIGLREVQKAGGKRMDVASFRRGFAVQVGTKLGESPLKK